MTTTHKDPVTIAQLARITKARANLVTDHPFFGSLSMRLRVRPCEAHEPFPTMATDGRDIIFNPAWVASCDDAKLRTVVAHEVLHVANMHNLRRDDREQERWNIACDFAINGILLNAGFHMPEDALHDSRFDNMSAETIYDQIEVREIKVGRKGKGGGKGPQGDPGQMGAVLDATDDEGDELSKAGKQEREAEQRRHVAQAAQAAKSQGKLPASLQRVVDDATTSRVDWRDILTDLVRSSTPTDFTWMRPNRRHIADGLYLPGIYCEDHAEMAVCIDTSGSIDPHQLSRFWAELVSIVEEIGPSRVHVVACDADVHHTASYEKGQKPSSEYLGGGGGTDFRPALEHVMANFPDVSCCLYFTDLAGTFPDAPCPFPVIWAATHQGGAAPWGRTIFIGH